MITTSIKRFFSIYFVGTLLLLAPVQSAEAGVVSSIMQACKRADRKTLIVLGAAAIGLSCLTYQAYCWSSEEKKEPSADSSQDSNQSENDNTASGKFVKKSKEEISAFIAYLKDIDIAYTKHSNWLFLNDEEEEKIAQFQERISEIEKSFLEMQQIDAGNEIVIGAAAFEEWCKIGSIGLTFAEKAIAAHMRSLKDEGVITANYELKKYSSGLCWNDIVHLSVTYYPVVSGQSKNTDLPAELDKESYRLSTKQIFKAEYDGYVWQTEYCSKKDNLVMKRVLTKDDGGVVEVTQTYF